MTEERISLNVGGKTFETCKTTLLNGASAERPNFFSNILSEEWKQTSKSSDTVFVDRSPELFASVLHFLQYRKFRISGSGQFTIEDVLEEMMFYGYTVPLSSQTLMWHKTRQEDLSAVAKLTSEIQRKCMDIAEQIAAQLFDPSLLTTSAGASVFVISCVDDVVAALPQDRPNAKVKVGMMCRSVGLLELLDDVSLLEDGPSRRFMMSYLKNRYHESVVTCNPVTVGFVEKSLTDYAVQFHHRSSSTVDSSGTSTPSVAEATSSSNSSVPKNRMFQVSLV